MDTEFSNCVVQPQLKNGCNRLVVSAGRFRILLTNFESWNLILRIYVEKTCIYEPRLCCGNASFYGATFCRAIYWLNGERSARFATDSKICKDWRAEVMQLLFLVHGCSRIFIYRDVIKNWTGLKLSRIHMMQTRVWWVWECLLISMLCSLRILQDCTVSSDV